VATALSKLGIKTAFVSAIGDDERGDEIMTLLEGKRPLDAAAPDVVGAITSIDTSTVQGVSTHTVVCSCS
jgi:sugar/nucleoside kinase (ribokinase family)